MRNGLDMRIWATKEILKRYLVFQKENIIEYQKDGKTRYYNNRLVWDKDKQERMTDECINICCSTETNPESKKAARVLLDVMMGKQNSNSILDGFAIVTDRNDSLVNRWRKKVLSKYKKCVLCGSSFGLEAHHISHWSDDPVNRINPENGIALCSGCHAEEHPELSNLILPKRRS